jgi:hypothetical protein
MPLQSSGLRFFDAAGTAFDFQAIDFKVALKSGAVPLGSRWCPFANWVSFSG